jgi:two-component sensor histidine kinase
VTSTAGARPLLDCLSEPAFLLEASGKIVVANRAGRALVGQSAEGQDFARHLTGSPAAFADYLRRCTGTTSSLPGSVRLRDKGGQEMVLKASGARVRAVAGKDPVHILLRLLSGETDGFSVLARQVRILNEEVHRRRRAQAALEEALQRNETLFRELQHRVKNNVQMLLGLFAAARRDTSHEEVRTFLEEVAARLSAVVAAQQLMYQAHDLAAVGAPAFVQGLCEAIRKSHARSVQLSARAFDGNLPNDVVLPLALIASELLTNAYKHGATGEDGVIVVELDRDGEDFVLMVRDNGPGMPTDAKERRSSGLGLVRGLCRQIRGSLVIENVGGTRCTVRFSGPESQP